MSETTQDAVIRRLVRWGEGQSAVRAMILHSSRANPHATVDPFSDYDVILAVPAIRPFWEDRTWLEDLGKVLVVYRNPVLPHRRYAIEEFACIVHYEDGTKIDFALFPLELVRRMVQAPALPDELDHGYAVLLDKDGLTAGLKPPTYRAYIPSPPSEEAYRDLIDEFLNDCAYVAKHLWRNALIPAQSMLDCDLKHGHLRRMLEWRIEIDHNWSVKLGAHGRGLVYWLAPERWAELEGTYAGAGFQESFAALFRTIELLRKVAVEVADGLGFSYPHDLDERMMAYLNRVKNLERPAMGFCGGVG